jgi:coenzyme F420 hydrogenase subunit beta
MNTLLDVIDQDWCIGCGACVHADDSLSLILDREALMFRPSGPGNHLAVAVCPAVGVDYGELQRFVFGDVPSDEYGVVESVYLAQSVDRNRNVAASSGGLIKELLVQLLDRDDIDGAIALSHVDSLDFQPSLITESSKVDQLPGSIYHNLDQGEALRILKEAEGRFVLVGIPCVLEGIYKYISVVQPDLLERIALTIGLLCGWQYTHHSIEAMGQYLSFDPEDIDDISYRGGGPIGKFRVQLADGSQKSASRRVDFSYQVAFDRHFNTRRCHVCVNHSNFLADVVVGDAWLPSTLMTKTGISLVIARSATGRTQMKELAEREKIVMTEVGKAEISESQTDRVILGEFAYSYADFLEEQDIPVPILNGPNRGSGTPVSRSEIEKFHSEYLVKTELQRNRRYRRLWWRKATKGLPQLVGRYWRWFTVRVLRIKSIKRDRHEISRNQLRDFS